MSDIHHQCDKVPEHIERLRFQMHMEWLNQIPENLLSKYPEWIMEKYFVDGSGEPDRTKTAEVVGIPYSRSSDYRTCAVQLREAASRISGLHQATGLGSTETIYLGWDQGAVDKAAKDHRAKETQADKAKADSREAERAAKHKEYVAKAKKPKFGPSVPSPVGRYIVDCEDIESQWSDMADEMTLAIRATSTPGIYQTSFNFGVIEGVMMLSSDERILDSFCAQQDQDDSSDEDHSEEDDSQDDSVDWEISLGSKRKATATHARPPKKAKVADASKPEKYFLRLRSRDTGTGEIHPTAEKGTIEFSGPDLSSFTGEADMGCFIGDGVTFTARKVSAELPELQESWNDYSEAAYERARVGRWR
jgi:hypothetical protein